MQPSLQLRRGAWLGPQHDKSFGAYRAPRRFDPDGAFRGNNVLAAWCELYPENGTRLRNDVYQFGVYTGGSMAGQRKFFELLGLHFGTMWGFDSFEGLPQFLASEINETEVRIYPRDWRAGAFSAADALGVHDYAALVANLTARIGRKDGPVEFVRGFFNESLTPTLAQDRKMQPALYVDIDGDICANRLEY